VSDLYERLMAAADGDWGQEAAVDLLHRHGRWLQTLDGNGYIEHDPEFEDYASIDWDTVARALNDTGSLDTIALSILVGSGSERQVLAAAASLGGGEPVRLRSGFGSLDHVNRRIVLHAIAHAMAGRTYAREVLPL
jgi:hypothetical protein